MNVRLATLHSARRVGLRTKADAMNLDETTAGVTHPEPTNPGETKPETMNPVAMNPDAMNPVETDLKVQRRAKDVGDVAAVVVVDEEAEIAATRGHATRTGVRVPAVERVP
jgi:hypothetical protein